MQDSGRYTCEATNVAGKTEKNYNLNVWGEFLSFPLNSCSYAVLVNKEQVIFFFFARGEY